MSTGGVGGVDGHGVVITYKITSRLVGWRLAGSPVGVGRPALRYEHVAWAGNGVLSQCPRVSPSPSLSPVFRGPREGRGYLPNSDEPERPCVLPKTKLVN